MIWTDNALFGVKLGAFGLLFALLAGCGKNRECERTYLYEIPFTVLAKDTVKANDTMWLESRLPLQITDLNEGQILYPEEIDFGIEVLFGKLDSTRQDVGYLFDAFATDGAITPVEYDGGRSYRLSYERQDSMFYLKMAIFTSETGSYALQLFSFYHIDSNVAEHFFSKEVDFDDGECREMLNVQFKTVSPFTDNNYYLVEEIAEYLPSGFTQESANRTGTYAFVVVE